MSELELSSLIEEAKEHCGGDEAVSLLIEKILDYEKGHPHSYQNEYLNFISSLVESKK